ncbi:hypothetical protein BJV82DRAFT_652617 [Fennellomyces sp. T-0311]|nr:hypothetical protein BJV82DRAFT_652617 [Fennellomyces sp. T-0311]
MYTATPLRTSCRRHSGLSAVGRCAVTKSSYPARSVVQRVASRPPWVVKLLSLWCISQLTQTNASCGQWILSFPEYYYRDQRITGSGRGHWENSMSIDLQKSHKTHLFASATWRN